MKRFAYILILSILSIFSACTTTDKEPEIVLNSLRIDPRSVTLEVGGTMSLKAVYEPDVEGIVFSWSSTDMAVASVTEEGVVTAVAEGSAQIVCKYGEQVSARCAVQVVPKSEPEPEPEPEPTPGPKKLTVEELATPLSKSMIFSSRQLRYPGTVMQCFDFYDSSQNGYIYFTQCGADATTGNKWIVVASRVKRGAYGDATVSGEAMYLRWFGHGTIMCVEHSEADGKDYIWVNSNGTLSGANYTNQKTVSRILYEPNKTYEHRAGEHFYLDSYRDSTGKTWSNLLDFQVNIDFKTRRMLAVCRTSGVRHLIIYDLDKVLALKEQDVTLTRTWGGEGDTGTTKHTTTETIKARNVGSLTPLSSFTLKILSSTSDFSQTHSSSYQGHAIAGEYIYWYEGNAYEKKSGSGVYDNSQAYLEIFDYTGKRVVPRTRVAAVSDVENLTALVNLNTNLYCEAEGVQVKGDHLYLGIVTHKAGMTSKNRVATILEYKIFK